MIKWIFGAALLMLMSRQVSACRFTVREIGFSTLSQDIYTLLVLDEHADPDNVIWTARQAQLQESNIRLVVINPKQEKANPLVKQVMEEGMVLPATLLMSPDGKKLHLGHASFNAILNAVIDSPLRKRIRSEAHERFAFVLCIEGSNNDQNRKAAKTMAANCEHISNIMPHMPKEVKKGPLLLPIGKDEFETEKVMLWSLGLTKQPTEPVAYVLYGRGRIMGDAVSATAIADNQLYKLMSMVGADCECGLDRKWMLGHQIPLLWPASAKQLLLNEVDFDVDNPMILAEMSRILAKEVNAEAAGEVSFGPEVLNLNEAFNQPPEGNHNAKPPKQTNVSWWWYLGGMVTVVLLIGIIAYRRNVTK